jgi:hypothetical protein
MNTAVPFTRTGFRRSTSARNMSIGTVPRDRIARRIARPRFHVVMSVKTNNATGDRHPPARRILSRFEKKNARSIDRKNTRNAPALSGDQPHWSRTTM